MNIYKKKITVIASLLVISICMLAGCGKGKKEDTASATDAASGTDTASGTDNIPVTQVVMKVGDEDITKEETLVYSLYELLSGSITYMNVLTDESLVEDMIVEQIRNTKIIYLEAVAEGCEFDDEEEELVESLIDSFKSYVTDEVLEQYEISDEIIEKVFRETYLVEKFETEKQNELGASLTDAALEEYSDYNFQSLKYIIVPLVETDEDGNPVTDDDGNKVALSDEDKAAAKEKAEKIVAEINSGEDVDTVIEKYEVADYCEDTSGYVGSYTDELNETLGSMEVGQCTDVVETESCYYSIALLTENDEDVKLTYAYAAAKSKLSDEFSVIEEEWLAKVTTDESDIIDDFWGRFDLAELATTLYTLGLLS